MDRPKTTVFVSGANRGLGKHLADQFTSRVLGDVPGEDGSGRLGHLR
jgi:NAD(P)-dependent dehydrogenase (short-subunit alcohol dehydrogenase family)